MLPAILQFRNMLSTFVQLQKRISYELYLFTIYPGVGHKIATCVLRMELNKLINCQQYFRPLCHSFEQRKKQKPKQNPSIQESKQANATWNVILQAAWRGFGLRGCDIKTMRPHKSRITNQKSNLLTARKWAKLANKTTKIAMATEE